MKQIKPVALILTLLILCGFTARAADWTEFSSKVGNFKMKFPGHPEETIQDVQVGDVSLKLHLFIYDASNDSGDNLTYYVMYCDYPKTMINSDLSSEILDTFLKNSIEGGAKSMNGKIVSITKENFKGFPGRKVKINIMDGQGIGYQKVCLVHNRAYFSMVLCESQKDNNPSIEQFLNSFELLDNNFALPEGASGVTKWVDVQSKEGGYKIMFPGAPKNIDKDINTEVGPCKMHMYMYEGGDHAVDNEIYGIGYTVYPNKTVSSDLNETIIDSLLKLSVMGSASQIKGKIISVENITYNDYHGKRAKISFADGEGIMNEQIYLVGSKSYILEVGCEPKNDNNLLIDKFFNSFTLLDNKK